MLDLGWSELLVVGIVALIVVGPKDLPRMLRTLGQYAAKAKSVAREFQRSMDDAARQADLDDLRDVKKDLDKDFSEARRAQYKMQREMSQSFMDKPEKPAGKASAKSAAGAQGDGADGAGAAAAETPASGTSGKPAAKTGSGSGSKSAGKPAAKPAAKSSAKPAAKSSAKSSAKPAPKSAPKSSAAPADEPAPRPGKVSGA